MIVLWLLAAHMTGDYLLQTRWQAVGKFGWTHTAIRFRFNHCFTYTLCFAAVALAYGGGPLAWFVFPVAIGVLHFLTDSRRFTATPGDVLVWRGGGGGWSGWPDPNPWPPMPILIDQSLHFIQIAALASLLLR